MEAGGGEGETEGGGGEVGGEKGGGGAEAAGRDASSNSKSANRTLATPAPRLLGRGDEAVREESCRADGVRACAARSSSDAEVASCWPPRSRYSEQEACKEAPAAACQRSSAAPGGKAKQTGRAAVRTIRGEM